MVRFRRRKASVQVQGRMVRRRGTVERGKRGLSERNRARYLLGNQRSDKWWDDKRVAGVRSACGGNVASCSWRRRQRRIGPGALPRLAGLEIFKDLIGALKPFVRVPVPVHVPVLYALRAPAASVARESLVYRVDTSRRDMETQRTSCSGSGDHDFVAGFLARSTRGAAVESVESDLAIDHNRERRLPRYLRTLTT